MRKLLSMVAAVLVCATLHAQDFDFDDETVLPAGVEFLKKLLFLP